MLKHTSQNLSTTLKYSYKNEKIIFFLIFLEFYIIFIECIISLKRIFYFYKNENSIVDFSLGNSLHYIIKFMKTNCDQININNSSQCNFPKLPFIIITSSITLIFFLFHIQLHLKFSSKKEENRQTTLKKGNISKYLNLVCVNSIDIIFKIFSIFLFFIYFNQIFILVNFQQEIFYGVLSIIISSLLIYLYFYQINFICLHFQFTKNLSYHYDFQFSKKYDFIMATVKIIIAFQYNLLYISGEIMIKNVFLDCIILLLILILATKILTDIFYVKLLPFNLNKIINLFRIYLILVNAMFIIILTFVDMVLLNLVYFILLCIAIMMFNIFLIMKINNKLEKILYSGEKLIHLLTHFLVIHFTNSEDELEKEINKTVIIHSILCKVTNCYICKCIIECNSNHRTFLKSLMPKNETALIEKLSKDENLLLEFIAIIYEENNLLPKHSEFSLIYKTKNLVDNCPKKNILFFYLQSYFKKLRKSNNHSINNLQRYELMKKYDETISLLIQSVDIIKEGLNTFESNFKKDLYLFAKIIHTNKSKILDNLSFIMLNKNLYVDKYSLIIIRFTFNKIYQCEIGDYDSYFDFNTKHDILLESYEKDKFILLEYIYSNSSLIIKKATKGFINFQNEQFDELFPGKFKIESRDMLINYLKKESEIFIFESLIEDKILTSKIKSSDKNKEKITCGFINNIKFNCSIHRSMDMEKLFIFAEFQISHKEFAIFEQTNDNNMKLVSFSKNIGKMLCLSPMWFPLNQETKYTQYCNKFYFSKIFQKKDLIHSNDLLVFNNLSVDRNLSNDSEYTLNYRRYFDNVYKHEIKKIKEMNEEIEENELKINCDNIICLYEQDIVLNININSKYIFNKSTIYGSRDCKYIKYEINILNNNKRRDGIDNSTRTLTTLKNDIENHVQLIDENFEKYIDDNSSSLSQVSIYKNNNPDLNLLSYFKKNQEEVEDNIKRFTSMMIWINIFLIIFSGVYLVIGLIGSRQANELYLIRNNFNDFKYGFHQSCLSLFYNVGIYKRGTTDMSDYTVNGYWTTKEHPNVTISVGDYANLEAYYKLDKLKNIMMELQNKIYSFSFTRQLTDMFSFSVSYYSLRILDDQIGVNTRTLAFIDAIDAFINKGKLSIFDTTFTMIYIFNFDMENGNYDFSEVYDKNITNVQRTVYEMIMNYPNFLKSFNNLYKDLMTFYSNEMERIKNINIYMSLALIGMHTLLIFVSIMVIRYLTKTVTENNLELVRNLNHDSIKIHKAKFDIIQELNYLYKSNPVKLYKDLKKTSKTNFFKKTSTSKNDSNESKSNETINLKNYNAKFYIDNLTKPLVKKLIFIFTFYYTYSFLYLYIFNNSYVSLIEAFDFYTSYTQIDSNLMNYILLLQTIMFSNQTDFSLAKFLKDSEKFDLKIENGYISELIENTHQNNLNLEIIYSKSSKFEIIRQTGNELTDCHKIYTTLNDDIINNFESSYPGNSLKLSLEYLCKQYYVLNTGNFMNIAEEVNFIFFKLIKKFYEAYGDYVKEKIVNDETSFFDAFTIMVLIVRPVQNFINNSVLNLIVLNAASNYLLIIVLNLVSNILIELFIFYFLKKNLIEKVHDINLNIKCLSKCIN